MTPFPESQSAPGQVNQSAVFDPPWAANLELPDSLWLDDHIQAFVSFAKDGEKATFMDLARCLGVPPEQIEEMWEGILKRIGKGDAEDSQRAAD